MISSALNVTCGSPTGWKLWTVLQTGNQCPTGMTPRAAVRYALLESQPGDGSRRGNLSDGME